MPELPEVETVRRQLAPLLVGRTVLDAGSHPSGKFTPAIEVVGAGFTAVDRRGKFLLFDLDDQRQLVVHLGMTGRLGVDRATGLGRDREGDGEQTGKEGEPDPHLRAWWLLDDASRFTFIDVRRFGRIRVVPRGDYRAIPTLHHAGPEPWARGLDGPEFDRLLRRSRRPIKTRLLSQRPIAGVGNIYADEALWLARIDPRATRLSPERAERLLGAIRAVLEQGLANGGTTLRDYRNAQGGLGSNQHSLAAYGRSGEPCLRCGSPLRSAQIDARTTTWCGSCQRR